METLRNPELGTATMEKFRDLSLGILATQLTKITYEGYPTQAHRLYGQPNSQEVQDALKRTEGSDFAQAKKHLPLPSLAYDNTDPLGRPLHPWFKQMVSSPKIGVALGNGFYWQYGPNKTADGIAIRYDLEEPHVLIINRGDTGQPALAGGFVDQGETPLQAAYRENNEEVDANIFDIKSVDHTVELVYSGELADLRATAHAWPHTDAFALHIKGKVDTPMRWKGGDDAETAYWQPASQLSKLFGSHRLLAYMALKRPL